MKFTNKLRTKTSHIICELGLLLSYIPIIYSEDISLIKGFSGIALLIFLISMIFPVNGYEIVLIKFKEYLSKLEKNNPNISFIKKELNRLENKNL